MESSIKEKLVLDNNEVWQANYKSDSPLSTKSNKNNVSFESNSFNNNSKLSEAESEYFDSALLHNLQSYLWTIKDKDRLNSIYNLAVKQGSFHDHNNNLVTLNIDLEDIESNNNQDDVVFCIMKFPSLNNSNEINPALVRFKDLKEILNINKLSTSNPSSYFIWINIFDLSCLNKLVKFYNIHEILAHRFYDLRSFRYLNIYKYKYLLNILSN
jgi:hypothetical protein